MLLYLCVRWRLYWFVVVRCEVVELLMVGLMIDAPDIWYAQMLVDVYCRMGVGRSVRKSVDRPVRMLVCL